MTAESELKVIPSVETDGENQRTGRGPDGRFLPGNQLGKGGSRPGSGRPPKPAAPGLLKQLYDILDESAPRALEKLTEFIESSDEKVALKACATILAKVLPETKLLQNWNFEGREAAEELESVKKFLAWKMDKDVQEAQEAEILKDETVEAKDRGHGEG